MARVITGPATNITKHPKSHVRGWSLGWAELLGADINETCSADIYDYDEIYLDHGVNWAGSLNLFAGATDSVFERFDRLMQFHYEYGKIASLDWEMPDYGNFLMKRLKAPTTSDHITPAWCSRLSEVCKAIKHIKQTDLGVEWLSWGDSHTPAFAPKGSAVSKLDGRTLYGVIKDNTLDKIEVDDRIKGITLCLGHIDVRHHLCRPESISVKELCEEYLIACRKLRDRLNYSLTRSVHIEVVAPVPIEHEDRKIPKTGYFKKTPFYGSREERQAKTLDIMNCLIGGEFPVISPPGYRYSMDGEEYAKEYMELGGSVHMAPPYYRRYDKEEWKNINVKTR